MRTRVTAWLLVPATVLAALAAADADARVVWVASNGSDTPTCGGFSRPCRSISFGIAHAVDGDYVLVRPGRYGDIDDDLQYTSNGDEVADLNVGCIVCINKRVILASTDGAQVTVIDPPPREPPPGAEKPPGLRWTILITAAGAQLGDYNRGFTIYGNSASDSALDIESHGGDFRVIGNVVLNGGLNLSPGTGTLVIDENTVRNAANCMQVAGDRPVKVVDNFVEGCSGFGFFIDGPGRHIVARNTAIGSQFGFGFGSGRYSVTANVASANELGFYVPFAGPVLRRNTAVGNDLGFSFNNPPDTVANSFHTNNMIGNQVCGVVSQVGHLDARNNYWGSVTGPGAKPADAVCNNNGGTTIVVPFATVEFDLN